MEITKPLPCDYFPDKKATLEFTFENSMTSLDFQTLIESGFKHLTTALYRPSCPDCGECKPTRVLVQNFTPNRSMRRNWKNNQDLQVISGEPKVSVAKSRLYQHYNEARHPSSDCIPLKLLHLSPVQMLETSFYLRNKLVCVTLSDIIPTGLMMVYSYFEPELKERSLGTYSILWAIEHCRQEGKHYCYLGDYVKGCKKTEYKKRFIPHETLESDGIWH